MTFVHRVTALDTCRGIGVLLGTYAIGSNLTSPGAAGADPLPLLSSWGFPEYPLELTQLSLAVLVFMVGMSVPFGIHHMVERGWSKWFIVFRAIQRAVLLALVAAGIGIYRSFLVLHGTGLLTFIYGAALFAVLYLLFLRFSMDIPLYQQRFHRTGAFILTMLSGLTMYVVVEDLALFARTDETLVMFADVTLFSMVIWTYTRTNITQRLGVLLLLFGLRMSLGAESGWTASLWEASPLQWLFRPVYLQYLFLAVPGTVAGGLVFDRKLSGVSDTDVPEGIPQRSFRKILWLLPATVVMSLVTGSVVPLPYTLPVVWLLLYILEREFRSVRRKDEVLLRSLVRWGAFWLLLGQVLMPADAAASLWHVPMGYLFVSAGAMTLLYAWISIISERLRERSPLQYLTACGMHPLAATASVLLIALPVLLPVMSIVRSQLPFASGWIGPVSGVCSSLLAAAISVWFVRKDIAWRT